MTQPSAARPSRPSAPPGAPRATSRRTTRLQPRRATVDGAPSEVLECILGAAKRILGTEGWDKLSTNRIARVAGVSVGSVYRYFPNRDAVARALVHRIWTEQLALVSAVFAAGTPTIEGIVRAYGEHVAAEPQLHAEYSVHLLHLVAEDARVWDEQVVSALVAAFDREFLDHPRKRAVCENIYTAGLHVARRDARWAPDALRDGQTLEEFLRMVRAYLAEFPRRT